MTRLGRRLPWQHLHACDECGRPFYLCSQRDCYLVPEVCRGCEMDRRDAYMTSQEGKERTRADHREIVKGI